VICSKQEFLEDMRSNHKNRRTRLRVWREAAGWNQRDAAAWFGMSHASYSAIESGRMEPSPAMAQRLEARFAEPASELLKRVPTGVLPKLRSDIAKNDDARSA
jgi:transcriptional regulator with XRE-family HTH domain